MNVRRAKNKIYGALEGGSFQNNSDRDNFLVFHQFGPSFPLVKGRTQKSTKRSSTHYYCSTNGCPFDIRCVTLGSESGYFEGLGGAAGLVHNHVGGNNVRRGKGLTNVQRAYFVDNHSQTDKEIYAYFCLQSASDPVNFPITKKRSISNYRAYRKDLQEPAPPTVMELGMGV